MRANIRWKPRHSIMVVILIAVFAVFIFRNDIFTVNKAEDLASVNEETNNVFTENGYNSGADTDFKNIFAARCSGPYPVKEIYFQDEKVIFKVSVAGNVREFELFGAKLPEDEDLRIKALTFITEFVKNKPVYLEVERKDGVRLPDDLTIKHRHIFVENPENNYDARYEWRIHLGMLLISQGYVFLSDESLVQKSVYSLLFQQYKSTGEESKQGIYADSEATNKQE